MTKNNWTKVVKHNWVKVVGYMIIYLAFFSMGIVGGMILQQAITQSTLIKVADNLDGVVINVDLNETQIVDGITDFYKPYFDEALRGTEDADIGEVNK